MRLLLGMLAVSAFIAGCTAMPPTSSAPPVESPRGFRIGSVTSKNLFIDSSQFDNRNVRLRLRNSSGDSSLDVSRLRGSIEAGLRAAGYKVVDENAGIVIDVNAFQMQSASRTGVSTNSGLGAIVGAVAGYEAARRPGGIKAESGMVLGAVAGAALEEVLRNFGEYSTFIALCDVNIGVVKKQYTKKDRFVVGGNKLEHREPDEPDVFTNFVLRETVRVAVYAGDDASKAPETVGAILDRLGRIISNLI